MLEVQWRSNTTSTPSCEVCKDDKNTFSSSFHSHQRGSYSHCIHFGMGLLKYVTGNWKDNCKTQIVFAFKSLLISTGIL